MACEESIKKITMWRTCDGFVFGSYADALAFERLKSEVEKQLKNSSNEKASESLVREIVSSRDLRRAVSPMSTLIERVQSS